MAHMLRGGTNMSKDIYGDFYNPTKLISTGKPYLFSIGVRSSGKSTGWLIHLLKEFMKHKKQFIYLRRDKDELEATAENAFTNAIVIYNSYYKGREDFPQIESFEYKKQTYFINGEIAGYGMSLSTQQKSKSLPLSEVWWILYDEFLISKAGGRYLGGKDNPFKECESLMSLFITVDRGIDRPFRNELRCICIGNNETYMSPIFMRLGIDKMLTRETKFLNPKNQGWAVEQTFDVKALADAKLSNAYLLSSDYSRSYAFGGGIFDETFIGRPEGKIYPMFNVKYNDDEFGIGQSEFGEIFVSSKPYNVRFNLALTGKDHAPNYRLVKEWRSSDFMVALRDGIVSGHIYYETQKAKYAIETFFAYDK